MTAGPASQALMRACPAYTKPTGQTGERLCERPVQPFMTAFSYFQFPLPAQQFPYTHTVPAYERRSETLEPSENAPSETGPHRGDEPTALRGRINEAMIRLHPTGRWPPEILQCPPAALSRTAAHREWHGPIPRESSPAMDGHPASTPA